jgi:hypothetical protein
MGAYQVTLDELLIESLPLHIAERITVNPVSGCWIAGPPRDRDGYARIGNRGLHRVVYTLLVGPIPDDLVTDHVVARGCISRACINPAHLEPVTHRENVIRGRSFAAINARKVACGTCGTPYDEVNTYRPPGRPRRACRRCNAAAVRRYKVRHLARGQLARAA